MRRTERGQVLPLFALMLVALMAITALAFDVSNAYAARRAFRTAADAAALAGALDLISILGGGTVEGYPEDAGSVPAGFLFNGALSTYERLGFTRSRQIGKHRWVVVRAVEPA